MTTSNIDNSINIFETGNMLPIVADRLVQAVDSEDIILLNHLLSYAICKEILETQNE